MRKKPDVDIVLDVLEAVVAARPDSEFAKSLLYQYRERGGLSRRQLEGLLSKARKVPGIPDARLATLEAVILKKPLKYKSEKPAPLPEFKKDEKVGMMINDILAKYPEHKRILFLKAKYDGDENLPAGDVSELERLHRLLVAKG